MVMKNTVFHFFLTCGWLLVLVIGVWLIGCESPEVVPTIYVPESLAATKAALVSVLATGSDAAEINIKTSLSLKQGDWQLTAQTADGKPLTLKSDGAKTLNNFTLNTFLATGLTAGQTYQFQLRYVFNARDTLVATRTYRHTSPAYWRRLAHVDTDEGDFTGSVLANTQVQSVVDTTGVIISVTRYVDEQKGDAWVYDRKIDQWLTRIATPNTNRRGLVRFRLKAVGSVYYTMIGLGYLTNDRSPGGRAYLKDMGVLGAGTLTPTYAGRDGEIAFFTTTDRAFLLTQETSPELWIRRGDWSQYRGRDFPEVPGTMATFALNGIGYVVNQIDGRPPHLYAYNPDLDQWTRRADFPGTARSRGVGFSVGGKGYFGLGVAGDDERGLRDIYQYDPATDTWQYVTDYPGQGNRYLISYSTDDRAYLGWGYESQASPSGGARQIGCTDFWEFKP